MGRKETKNVTYKEARVYLDEMSKYGSVLGLDTVRRLLRELGNPQDDLRFVHIAGTNGKGSVLAYTSTILSEAGYRIGRYVSPTVVSYLERIQVDGEWICESAFAEKTEQVRKAIARMEQAGERLPTVFEIETAIAFLYFKEQGCQIVVLETGLGGRLDATNVVPAPECAVFTSIARDHIGVLGDTVEEIAEEKAGIIKPGCMVVSAIQEDPVRSVLERRAREQGCPIVFAEPVSATEETEEGFSFSAGEDGIFHSSLPGITQMTNVGVALETIRALQKRGYSVSGEAKRRGLERTRWPGRFEKIHRSPTMILDGAHNEAAAEKLRQSLLRYFQGRRLVFLMGVFQDKEYPAICRSLCPLAEEVYTVSLPDSMRTLPAELLAEEVRRWCPRAVSCKTISEGVRKAAGSTGAEDVLVVFGSLSYLEEVRQEIKGLLQEDGKGEKYNDGP